MYWACSWWDKRLLYIFNSPESFPMKSYMNLLYLRQNALFLDLPWIIQEMDIRKEQAKSGVILHITGYQSQPWQLIYSFPKGCHASGPKIWYVLGNQYTERRSQPTQGYIHSQVGGNLLSKTSAARRSECEDKHCPRKARYIWGAVKIGNNKSYHTGFCSSWGRYRLFSCRFLDCSEHIMQRKVVGKTTLEINRRIWVEGGLVQKNAW